MRHLLILGLVCTANACGDSKQGGDVGGGTCEEADRVPLGNVPQSQWPPGIASALDDYESSVGLSIEGTVLCDLDEVDDGVGTVTIAGVCDRSEMEIVTYEGAWCSNETVVSCPSTTVTLDGWFEEAGFASELELVTNIEEHEYWAVTDGSDEEPTLSVGVWEGAPHVSVEIPPASDDTATRDLGDGVAAEDRASNISCTLLP